MIMTTSQRQGERRDRSLKGMLMKRMLQTQMEPRML